MGVFQEVLSPVAGYLDRQDRQSAAEIMNRAVQDGLISANEAANATYTDIQALMAHYSTPGHEAQGQLEGLTSDGSWNQYYKDNGIDPTKDWTFDKGIKDYLDPAMQFRIDAGTHSLDASAASKGGLFSGGHATGLEAYAQGQASNEYNNANTRMSTDKQNAYKVHQDRLDTLKASRLDQEKLLNDIVTRGQTADTNTATARQAQGNTLEKNAITSANSQGQTDASRRLSGWNWGDSVNMLAGVGDAALTAYGMGAFNGSPEIPDVSGAAPQLSADSTFTTDMVRDINGNLLPAADMGLNTHLDWGNQPSNESSYSFGDVGQEPAYLAPPAPSANTPTYTDPLSQTYSDPSNWGTEPVSGPNGPDAQVPPDYYSMWGKTSKPNQMPFGYTPQSQTSANPFNGGRSPYFGS